MKLDQKGGQAMHTANMIYGSESGQTVIGRKVRSNKELAAGAATTSQSFRIFI